MKQELPTEVLIWTCIVVFIITATITLLSMLNLVKIPNEFRKKLFYALILEIVGCGVIVFKNYFTSPDDVNFIRITAPSNAEISITSGDFLYVNGICLNADSANFEGTIVIDNKNYPIKNFKLDKRNIFYASAQINDTLSHKPILIRVHLRKGNSFVFSDSTQATLTVNKK